MKTVKVSDRGDTLKVCVYTRGTRWDTETARRVKKEWRERAWKKINFRTCRQKLEDRIACNFTCDDWHCVFSLSEQFNTQDYKLIRRYWRAAMQRLRISRKRRGAPDVKYIYVTEGLHGNERLHIHALIPNEGIDFDELHKAWWYGSIEITKIENFEHRDNLAKYFTKEPAKYGRLKNDLNIFVASHNCAKPTVYTYGMWEEECYNPPDGYVLIHQSEDKNNDFGTFQYFVFKKPDTKKYACLTFL